MSACNCLHAVKLLNLQENDIIPHQFLLIKGRVDHYKCSEQRTISLSIANNKILTTGISSDTGKFKFLVDLGTTDKDFILKLQYCNAKCELNIIYKQKQSDYTIQPLIIVAQDETVDDKIKLYQLIVDLNLLLIQSVYAEKLKERAHGRLCFSFNGKCQVFTSCLTRSAIWQLHEHDLWSSFAKELLESEWGQERQMKFVAFIACSQYLGEEVAKTQDFSYQNIRKHIQGHAACGAGGLALFSSTYFYAWPKDFENILNCFEDKQKLNLSKEPDDSNYRKTRAGVYASSLGAVCHEIGHIFDLGHDLEGVMGSNFDYINHVFTINQMTEHLPHRIVQDESPPQLGRPRFTQLKKTAARGFLDCYREQKENDSFYFSPNSAIILAHHSWLRDQPAIVDNNDFDINFTEGQFIVVATKYPLKLLEIRTNSNSLVTDWFEFQKATEDDPVFQFDLSKFQNKLKKDCYVFAMSTCGNIKKISI